MLFRRNDFRRWLRAVSPLALGRAVVLASRLPFFPFRYPVALDQSF